MDEVANQDGTEVDGGEAALDGFRTVLDVFSGPMDLLLHLVRRNEVDELEGEFADVLAWLATLASIAGVDLEQAACRKYAEGCPRCRATPCSCG